VTNGLRNSPTGSKGRYNEVLATRLVIVSTGAMLTVGHEAPFRISALACRIESWIRLAEGGNSRQVSGTSDASKTQLGLTRSWRFPAFPSKTEVCQNLVGPISTRRFAENEGVANIFVSSELGSEAW
jgi:hypothetical protein